MMKNSKLNSKVLRSLFFKSFVILTLFCSHSLFGQSPDLNLKYIRTHMLIQPFENFKNMGGFELSFERHQEDKTFFRSFNFSFIGLNNSFYNVNFLDAQNTEQVIKYAFGRRIMSIMYGYAYYPIKKRTVFNPYARIYAGVGGLTQRSFGATPHWDELSYVYPQSVPKFRLAFSSRLNLGLEINLSHISPWDKESKFSLYLGSGINYMSKINAIDFTNRDGNNKVFGIISDERDDIEYTVDVGNLHPFSPIFFTFEFGLILRLLYK